MNCKLMLTEKKARSMRGSARRPLAAQTALTGQARACFDRLYILLRGVQQ